MQPLQASTYCALCNGDEMGIPVKCEDPKHINVARGYYRPEGIDPARSLMQGNGTVIDLDRPPVMAVPCPWGHAACLGGIEHGNASCEEGHHGVFCASCEQGWYRSSDRCRLCPQAPSASVGLECGAYVACAAPRGLRVPAVRSDGGGGAADGEPAGSCRARAVLVLRRHQPFRRLGLIGG